MMLKTTKSPLSLFVLFFHLLFCISVSPISSWAQRAKDMDLVTLKSGSIVEGCITARSETHVTVESIGGRVLLPLKSVQKITEATAGESELVLGLEMLKRKKFDRAKEFLDKAALYTQWNAEAQTGLKALDQELQNREEEMREKEKKEIERLIDRKGLQAGIDALKNRQKYNQDDYWGSYRGRMHLLMAKERLAHLDVNAAERHLTLADKYGVDPQAWNEVRNEIVGMRSKSHLLGKNAIAITPKKVDPKVQPKTFILKDWMLAAEQARTRGEKVPPTEWLQYIDLYARENALDPLLVWAMIDTESSWRPTVVSSAGAQGLMQLMPGTAKDMDVKDPFSPQESIKGGTQYMRFLLAMFNDLDTALAAYNVGPGTVERSNGIPEAGHRYIKKVRTRLAALQQKFGVIASS